MAFEPNRHRDLIVKKSPAPGRVVVTPSSEQHPGGWGAPFVQHGAPVNHGLGKALSGGEEDYLDVAESRKNRVRMKTSSGPEMKAQFRGQASRVGNIPGEKKIDGVWYMLSFFGPVSGFAWKEDYTYYQVTEDIKPPPCQPRVFLGGREVSVPVNVLSAQMAGRPDGKGGTEARLYVLGDTGELMYCKVPRQLPGKGVWTPKAWVTEATYNLLDKGLLTGTEFFTDTPDINEVWKSHERFSKWHFYCVPAFNEDASEVSYLIVSQGVLDTSIDYNTRLMGKYADRYDRKLNMPVQKYLAILSKDSLVIDRLDADKGTLPADKDPSQGMTTWLFDTSAALRYGLADHTGHGDVAVTLRVGYSVWGRKYLHVKFKGNTPLALVYGGASLTKLSLDVLTDVSIDTTGATSMAGVGRSWVDSFSGDYPPDQVDGVFDSIDEAVAKLMPEVISLVESNAAGWEAPGIPTITFIEGIFGVDTDWSGSGTFSVKTTLNMPDGVELEWAKLSWHSAEWPKSDIRSAGYSHLSDGHMRTPYDPPAAPGWPYHLFYFLDEQYRNLVYANLHHNVLAWAYVQWDEHAKDWVQDSVLEVLIIDNLSAQKYLFEDKVTAFSQHKYFNHILFDGHDMSGDKLIWQGYTQDNAVAGVKDLSVSKSVAEGVWIFSGYFQSAWKPEDHPEGWVAAGPPPGSPYTFQADSVITSPYVSASFYRYTYRHSPTSDLVEYIGSLEDAVGVSVTRDSNIKFTPMGLI